MWGETKSGYFPSPFDGIYLHAFYLTALVGTYVCVYYFIWIYYIYIIFCLNKIYLYLTDLYFLVKTFRYSINTFQH